MHSSLPPSKMNENLTETEVFMKQLEVANPQVFQLRCSMHDQSIDLSVSVFKPQNWEKKVAKEDLENSSYESER